MFVEVFDSDHIVLVGIENTERSLKVTLIGQNSSINASRNELLEVDDAVSIEITSNKNLVPVNIFTGSHLLEFRFGKSSRSIRVQSDKLSLEQLELFLGSSDVWNKAKHDLLEIGTVLILKEILLDIQLDLAVFYPFLRNFVDPWMLKKFRDWGSFELVLVQALADETFGLHRHCQPLGTFKWYLLRADCSLSLFEIFALEW